MEKQNENESVFLDKDGNHKFFVCDICGSQELVPFEGAEPNTCAMCMPIAEPDNEDCGSVHIRGRHFDYDE